jgi:nucleotide-binding universal stress UspA family protein
VLDHGPVPHALGAPAAGPAATPTAPAPPATPALRYVARLAEHAGVGCETAEITGEVTESVLDQARSAGAKLIVIGRSSRHDAGHPYVGSHTRHVLEFSDIPVLVVPHSPG